MEISFVVVSLPYNRQHMAPDLQKNLTTYCKFVVRHVVRCL